MLSKKDLRKIHKERRESLTDPEILANSLKTASFVTSMSEFSEAKVIALYAPINNESLTGNIYDAALKAGKRISYPRVDKQQKNMTFHYTEKDKLIKGEYGILSPNGSEEIAAPDDIDFIVIPALSSTLSGDRLGYGAGYYDRFLKEMSGETTTVILCHSINIAPYLPVKQHDIKVDYIATDTGLYHSAPPSDWLSVKKSFYTCHGVFEEEKKDGVKLDIIVKILTDTRLAGYSDSLEYAVNYPEIMEIMDFHAEKYSANLLEAVAENIAKDILERYPQIYKTIVAIEKKNKNTGKFRLDIERCQKYYL